MLIAASDFGNIRLGPDDAEPEFSFVSWTAMLFAAGMGIGLMYFGVGEPMQHFLKPPTVDPGTAAAAREAMLMTFFHWGFHAWAIYGLMVLAYFGFRYNLPLTLRSGCIRSCASASTAGSATRSTRSRWSARSPASRRRSATA